MKPSVPAEHLSSCAGADMLTAMLEESKSALEIPFLEIDDREERDRDV
jgi:hypothetical protein